VTWLLLIGAGLVAETVVIVALARAVTARGERDDAPQVRPAPTPRGSGRRTGFGTLVDQGAHAEPRDAVREAIS
jgi:hypothetical protein